FEHAGHADAAQLFPLCRLAPALVEIIEIGKFERLVHDRWKIAAVVSIYRRLERHRRRRNEILLANSHRIDSGNPRSFRDETIARRQGGGGSWLAGVRGRDKARSG